MTSATVTPAPSRCRAGGASRTAASCSRSSASAATSRRRDTVGSMEPAPEVEHEILPVRWGFGDVVIGFVAAYVLTVLFAPLVFAVTGVDANTPSSDVPIKTIALEQIPFYAGFLGAVLFAAYRKGNGLVRDFHLAMKVRDVLGIFAGVATQWAALLLYIP